MRYSITLFILIILWSCSENSDNELKFNGRLETTVVSISSKVNGTVDSVLFDEGDLVKQGQLLAAVDKDRIRLRVDQQKAVLAELDANLENISAQSQQVKSKLDFNEKMLAKTSRLISNGAATEQSMDELETENSVLKSQLAGLKSNRKMINNKISQAENALKLALLDLDDSSIKATMNGMIINRYIEPGELVNVGKTLFDLADLERMEAVIYVPFAKLNQVVLGNKANIFVDGVESPFEGEVSHIASEAEFTPKTILTEETRETLVYAVKVSVPNPELKLKIGMPVDVVIKGN